MIVYVDKNYKCFTESAEGRTAVESDFFDGKCAAFIEGYRYIPAGESWTNENGVTFLGEMVAPWKPYAELKTVQTAYEEALTATANTEDMAAAIMEGVNEV